MLSVSNIANAPIKTPAPQETAGSVAFRGNKAKHLKDVAKNLKCDYFGKNVSAEEAKKMVVDASNEAFKRFKLDQLFKTNPAEAKEVLMRETASKFGKDFKDIFFKFLKNNKKAVV